MLNLLRVIATSAVKAIKSPLAAVARPTSSVSSEASFEADDRYPHVGPYGGVYLAVPAHAPVKEYYVAPAQQHDVFGEVVFATAALPDNLTASTTPSASATGPSPALITTTTAITSSGATPSATARPKHRRRKARTSHPSPDPKTTGVIEGVGAGAVPNLASLLAKLDEQHKAELEARTRQHQAEIRAKDAQIDALRKVNTMFEDRLRTTRAAAANNNALSARALALAKKELKDVKNTLSAVETQTDRHSSHLEHLEKRHLVDERVITNLAINLENTLVKNKSLKGQVENLQKTLQHQAQASERAQSQYDFAVRHLQEQHALMSEAGGQVAPSRRRSTTSPALTSSSSSTPSSLLLSSPLPQPTEDEPSSGRFGGESARHKLAYTPTTGQAPVYTPASPPSLSSPAAVAVLPSRFKLRPLTTYDKLASRNALAPRPRSMVG